MSVLDSVRALREGESGFDLRVQGLFPHSGPCPLVPISSDLGSWVSPSSPWLELANSTAESQLEVLQFSQACMVKLTAKNIFPYLQADLSQSLGLIKGNPESI